MPVKVLYLDNLKQDIFRMIDCFRAAQVEMQWTVTQTDTILRQLISPELKAPFRRAMTQRP